MDTTRADVPAAGPAPTATTVPAAPPRRRRARWIVVLLLLAGAGVAAFLFLRESPKSRAFRLEAENLFVALRDGKAEDVYEQASFHFQQTLLLEKFEDLTQRMNATLGKFQRVVEVVDVDQSASVVGMTARVELELEFEQAITDGEVSFHRGGDGAWKLLGLNVHIPPELETRANELERQYERVRAPDEVIAKVHAILAGIRDGKEAEVHAAASPAFVSLEDFRKTLASQRAELGPFVAVLAIVSSAQNADKDRAVVQALLQYEKVKTTGNFKFMKVEGDWRLLGFKVVVPSLDLPK